MSRRVRVLLSAVFLASTTGCGPIDAPEGVTDLRLGLAALGEAFDSQQGRSRLLLLLSPA